MIHFLMHREKDTVGVAVTDIQSGQKLTGKALDNGASREVVAQSDIPLGHKVALKDFKVGETVTEYGETIGRVVQPIRQGEHVHVHNLKTIRWQ